MGQVNGAFQIDEFHRMGIGFEIDHPGRLFEGGRKGIQVAQVDLFDVDSPLNG